MFHNHGLPLGRLGRPETVGALSCYLGSGRLHRMASLAFRIGRVFWFVFSNLSHKLLILLGDSMESSGKPIATAGKPRPGGKKSKRDPINAILGKRPSGKQLRETLKEALPMEKAKRRVAKVTGRPSKYDDTIGQNVLALMADGLTVTEAADKLGINRSTIYRWSETNPAFASLLARAKFALAEHAFTQAAAVPRELYARVLAGEDIPGPAVAAARLYSDSLRWHAELLNRSAYGTHSKQSIELTGANGGPIQTATVLIDSRALSPDARDALRYALQAANAAPTLEHDDDEGEGG